MDLWWMWAIAALAVLTGVTLQRICGMGTGLVVAPTLAALFGGASGVIMSNVTAIVSAALILVTLRKRVDWRHGATIVGWAVPGALLGAILVSTLDPSWLTIFVGVVVLLALGNSYLRADFRERHSPLLTAVAGATGGFFNTAAGQAAPALILYARATRWEQRSFAATLQLVFLGMNVLSVALKSVIGLGAATLPPVWILPAVAVLVLGGVGIGTALEKHVPAPAARRLAEGLAVLGACLAIIRGVAGLF